MAIIIPENYRIERSLESIENYKDHNLGVISNFCHASEEEAFIAAEILNREISAQPPAFAIFSWSDTKAAWERVLKQVVTSWESGSLEFCPMVCTFKSGNKMWAAVYYPLGDCKHPSLQLIGFASYKLIVPRAQRYKGEC